MSDSLIWTLLGHLVCIAQWAAFILVDYAYLGRGRRFRHPCVWAALLALALAGWVSAALPWLMSAAAGCMVCVTAQEMIPEAVEPDEVAGVISIVLGFALMMALDVAL